MSSGVVAGIEDYGNKLGLPTVNGAVYYHEGYTSNPLVYCGAVGIGPRDCHPREPQSGDRVIVIALGMVEFPPLPPDGGSLDRGGDGPDGAFRPSGQGKWLADLYALARHRLRSAGVARIFGGGFCTYEDSVRFFSHRRDGVTGRMATLVWIQVGP